MAQGGVGKALSVFQLVSPSAEILKQMVTVPHQLSFADIGVASGLPQPRTTLRYDALASSERFVAFRATHHTGTEHRTIRVLCREDPDEIVHAIEDEKLDLDEPENDELAPKVDLEGVPSANPTTLRTAFQRVFGFPVLIDRATGRLYVYTIKDVAKAFLHRLQSHGSIKISRLCFDFSRLDESDAIDNVFNAWADSQGAIKKVAYFGTDVHHAGKLRDEDITAVRVDYEHNGNEIDLHINRRGRISTRSSAVTNAELTDILDALVDSLGLNLC